MLYNENINAFDNLSAYSIDSDDFLAEVITVVPGIQCVGGGLC